MTDPLQSQELELLKRYDAELQELESLAPAEVELSAKQALAIVTHMQVAAANPAVAYNPLLASAIAAAKQIQSSFSPESAIYEVLDLGWQEQGSGEIPPQKILKSTPCRSKRLRPPPYFPDDHHYL